MNMLQKLLGFFNSRERIQSRSYVTGHVKAVLYGPDGKVKQIEEVHNLVTTNGDKICAAGIKVGGGPLSTNAMKLGTATTAASKTGAGSFVAVADYISGSAKACDGSTPTAALGVVTFTRTYAAGEGTNATINRVSIVDNTTDAGEADATHTLSIAVFSGAINKGASDTLAITWTITFLGA